MVEASPAKLAVREYVPAGSFGVTEHDATPVELVVAVQVCVPLSVKVTGSPETGVLV